MEIQCNSERAPMRNYEQIRAKNAYAEKDSIGVAKEGGKAVAKKVPAMIVQDGFLGALAFAIEDELDCRKKGKKSAYGNVFYGIMKHLPQVKKDFGLCTEVDLQKFLDKLCNQNADLLRAITEEAIAYLNYLRRFAKPSKGEENQGDKS